MCYLDSERLPVHVMRVFILYTELICNIRSVAFEAPNPETRPGVSLSCKYNFSKTSVKKKDFLLTLNLTSEGGIRDQNWLWLRLVTVGVGWLLTAVDLFFILLG